MISGIFDWWIKLCLCTHVQSECTFINCSLSFYSFFQCGCLFLFYGLWYAPLWTCIVISLEALVCTGCPISIKPLAVLEFWHSCYKICSVYPAFIQMQMHKHFCQSMGTAWNVCCVLSLHAVALAGNLGLQSSSHGGWNISTACWIYSTLVRSGGTKFHHQSLSRQITVHLDLQ
jgi:hypothetical protein